MKICGWSSPLSNRSQLLSKLRLFDSLATSSRWSLGIPAPLQHLRQSVHHVTLMWTLRARFQFSMFSWHRVDCLHLPPSYPALSGIVGVSNCGFGSAPFGTLSFSKAYGNGLGMSCESLTVVINCPIRNTLLDLRHGEVLHRGLRRQRPQQFRAPRSSPLAPCPWHWC